MDDTYLDTKHIAKVPAFLICFESNLITITK